MSEPPPAYEALQNPYVPTETKQPATNPEFPPNPTFPAGNCAPPPTMQQPGNIFFLVVKLFFRGSISPYLIY
ncbi:hypothetical protein ANCCAN_05525 [Ancylostoma caninum]|uniref:Uncharacterized protein n=1 Tax=Ancylostoma caninum TaxID=29170 RepID=A0A368GZE3_ANCCA|nr:hypothetical protein ANCCAN_05525 [Ancylostoma caninum]